MKNKYRYSIDYRGDFDFESFLSPEDGDLLAKTAAEDFHNHHDGWESSWPITFEIFGSDGDLIGVYSVERQAVPEFTAYEVKP